MNSTEPTLKIVEHSFLAGDCQVKLTVKSRSEHAQPMNAEHLRVAGEHLLALSEKFRLNPTPK
jgi:hypothetical protein